MRRRRRRSALSKCIHSVYFPPLGLLLRARVFIKLTPLMKISNCKQRSRVNLDWPFSALLRRLFLALNQMNKFIRFAGDDAPNSENLREETFAVCLLLVHKFTSQLICKLQTLNICFALSLLSLLPSFPSAVSVPPGVARPCLCEYFMNNFMRLRSQKLSEKQ